MEKAYKTYKDSGVEWIGKIPQSWDVVKLSHYNNVIGGSTPRSNVDEYWDGGIPWVTTDDLGKITGKNIVQSRRTITQKGLDNCSASLVSKNSLIVSCRAPIGHLAINRMDTATNQGCKSIEIEKGFNVEFLYYYFLSAKVDLQSLGTGSTFMEISTTNFKNYKILKPELLEQTQIAAYLDYHTGLIDELIAKKETLIQKLQEQREAIINEAVTKGLNPDVELKDSGIEWLGDIPKHWEVVKLKYLTNSVDTGKTPSTTNQLYFENGNINWFSPGDFDTIFLSDSNKKITHLAVEELNINLYPKYSVLLIGIGATLGKVAIVNEKCYSNQQINSIQFKGELMNPYFGLFFLDSIKEIIRNESNSSTMAILNQSKTKELLLTVPPIDEQNLIVNYIKEKNNEIAISKDKIQTSIQKLNEYRQSLISEAVTGKIDVRDWQQPNS